MAESPEAIWAAYYERLKRFVRRRLPDPQTADDVLQEVYLKLHRHYADLRDPARLESWLYQIARNAVHDNYRRAVPLGALPDDVPIHADEDDDTEQRLAASVRSLLDTLPDDYREALLLSEIEGLPQQEVARRLGLSPSGAKSRIQRGRRLLRAALLNCCVFQFDRRGGVIDYFPRAHCCAR